MIHIPESPIDLFEIDPTTDGPVDEWFCQIDGCDGPVGWHLLPNWDYPDVEQQVWLQAWLLPDDRLVCADCAGGAVRVGEEQRRLFEAAMEAVQAAIDGAR